MWDITFLYKLFLKEALNSSKMIQASDIPLGCPSVLGGKTVLPKTPYLVIGYREDGHELETSSLVSSMLRGTVQASEGERGRDRLTQSGTYKSQYQSAM